MVLDLNKGDINFIINDCTSNYVKGGKDIKYRLVVQMGTKRTMVENR